MPLFTVAIVRRTKESCSPRPLLKNRYLVHVCKAARDKKLDSRSREK